MIAIINTIRLITITTIMLPNTNDTNDVNDNNDIKLKIRYILYFVASYINGPRLRVVGGFAVKWCDLWHDQLDFPPGVQ